MSLKFKQVVFKIRKTVVTKSKQKTTCLVLNKTSRSFLNLETSLFPYRVVRYLCSPSIAELINDTEYINRRKVKEISAVFFKNTFVFHEFLLYIQGA